MTTSNRTILVLGATGRQGGATVRHLLGKGWHVRALTRDPQQSAAQALREAGVEVLQGNNSDQRSLEAAMQGVYGVFSIQAAFADDEVEQGKRIADTAHSAGVQHFVYTSVQYAESLARVNGDGRKWEIEQYVRALGLPATILRPAFFMETLIAPRSDLPGSDVPSDRFAIAIRPDVLMGLIAVDDIGAFATLAFEHPEIYLGKTIELAGDALTPPQIAAAISRTVGREVPYVQIPIETLRQQNSEIARAVEFLNETGYPADIQALRRQYPGLMNFDTWLEREGKAVLPIKA
jgi:uncharacterized protein YbjT (DUF2867 family)